MSTALKPAPQTETAADLKALKHPPITPALRLLRRLGILSNVNLSVVEARKNYDKIVERLTAYFRKSGFSYYEVEEAFHQVLLKISQGRTSFTGEKAKAFTYLTRAVGHQLLDNRRKKENQTIQLSALLEKEEGNPFPLSSDEDHKPIDKVIKQEELARLREALESLPDSQRAVIALDLGGLKTEEIAEKLGVPIGTVLSRRHYALKALKEYLNSKK
ncbi:MAG: RNA polymerase sigma factor [Candidatus Dadabacteria bacterium]|nr:MAG: RNA polymerase sigma factor [Candidatus Dadabacteria bacterium]